MVKAYVYRIDKNTITETLCIVENNLKLHPCPNTQFHLFSLDTISLHHVVRTEKLQALIAASPIEFSRGSVQQDSRAIQTID